MSRYKHEIENDKKQWKSVKIIAIVLLILAFAFSIRLWRDGAFYFDFETYETQAVITEVTMQPRRVGNVIKYMQAIRYNYAFENQSFEGLEYAGKSVGKVKVGDNLQIQVLKRKPTISRILKEL
jgi:hypothetical protein